MQPGPHVRVWPTSATRRDLPSAQDTREFGTALADTLRAGDVLILSGPLGAGKTTLAQGIGAGLGVRERITSPTFVLARVHRTGRLPLVHVDAYRLSSMREVDDLDLDVDVEKAVTIVEWGHGLVEQLADSFLGVHLDRETGRDGDGDETRQVWLEPSDELWSQRLG